MSASAEIRNPLNAPTLSSTTLKADAKVMALIGFAHGVSHFFHLIVAPLFFWLGRDFSLSNAQLGLLMTGFFVVSGVGRRIRALRLNEKNGLHHAQNLLRPLLLRPLLGC